MASRTYGNIKQQAFDILGIESTDARGVRSVEAVIDTEYQRICGAENWDWLETHCQLDFTATTTSIDPPDGVTVHDHAGAIPARCRGIKWIELDTLGVRLTYRKRGYDALVRGQLGYAGRAIPSQWTDFERKIWLSPLPASAGTITVYYLAGYSPLTADIQEPLIPFDYRAILSEKAIYRIAARDGFDRSVQASARESADDLYRSMLMHCSLADPDYQSIVWFPGQL